MPLPAASDLACNFAIRLSLPDASSAGTFVPALPVLAVLPVLFDVAATGLPAVVAVLSMLAALLLPVTLPVPSVPEATLAGTSPVDALVNASCSVVMPWTWLAAGIFSAGGCGTDAVADLACADVVGVPAAIVGASPAFMLVTEPAEVLAVAPDALLA